jgi:hypothetical protein
MANASFTINFTVPRMYQIKGGKLVDGFEVEFYITEFGTTQSVQVPSLDVEVVRRAILDRIEAVRKVHALGGE